jgi:hypothetical protein
MKIRILLPFLVLVGVLGCGEQTKTVDVSKEGSAMPEAKVDGASGNSFAGAASAGTE